MAIATGTALAIGLGASAGASAYGAYKQGKAAKEASQQQVAASQQALAAQAPLYQQALQIAQQQAEQGRAGLMPYAQQGGQGLTALSSFLGVPASAGGPGAGAGVNRAGMPPPQNPNAAAFGNLAQGALGAGAALAPGGTLQKPTVMLRAPTGQTQAVPADQAAFFLARGATRA
jgi:hypothetical protein